MIQLKDALQQMERRDHRNRPVPFHVQICTCNEQTGEGGDLLDFENVVLARNAGDAKPARRAPVATAGQLRPANEWDNGTRNFYLLDSQQTRKAHIWLILQFNHQPVI